jgi:hypothetical protein
MFMRTSVLLQDYVNNLFFFFFLFGTNKKQEECYANNLQKINGYCLCVKKKKKKKKKKKFNKETLQNE